MVFQKTNPFPASLYENVVFPLRIAGCRDRRSLDEAAERYAEALVAAEMEAA
jgi:phosphate transport system ATP-binding protein